MPGQQQRSVRSARFSLQTIPFECAVHLDQRIADRKPAVEIVVGQQFVDADARCGHQLVLGHVFRTVGIEIHTRLQQVETREAADLEPLFGNSQPLARELHRITEIAQTQGLLHIIVILGRKRGDKILDRDAGSERPHLLQLLQPLVVGADAESVEKRPVHRNAGVEGLIVNAVFDHGVPLARGRALVVQRPAVAGRQIDARQHPGVGRRRVVVANALLVAYDADVVILLQSELQTPLQGHRLAALLRRGRSDSPRGQNR